MRRWSGRSMGARWQHAFFYGLIRLGGRKIAYFFLFFVLLVYMAKPDAARRCRPYLVRRFPEAGRWALFRHRWRLQRELGMALVDRAVFGITGEAEICMDEAEVARLRALHAEGRGLILLASHVGCWHISMAGLHDLVAAPASVVMYHNENENDRHYFEHRDGAPPFSVIDIAGGPQSAVAMMARLAGGGVLCLMGDRQLGDSPVCFADFLGGEIAVPYTAYHLAAASGAAVAVFFAYREGAGRVRHKLARVIRVPEKLGKQAAAYTPYAQEYANALEESAAAFPYQFFNAYDMWETRE